MRKWTEAQARELQKAEPLSETLGDRILIVEETYISGIGLKTPEEAKKMLDDVKHRYNSCLCWYCPEGHEGIFQDERGRWRPFRHHGLYMKP